jgi:hypothetical protein
MPEKIEICRAVAEHINSQDIPCVIHPPDFVKINKFNIIGGWRFYYYIKIEDGCFYVLEGNDNHYVPLYQYPCAEPNSLDRIVHILRRICYEQFRGD